MTDLRKIAAVMGGEVRGNVAAFPTPGHGKKDRGSWASLVPGAPDGVLIHSANGGDPLAIKDELRSKGALPQREDKQPAPLLRRSSVPRPMPVQVAAGGKHTAFIYHDESGAEVFRKVRTDLEGGDKTFSWHHDEGRKSGRGDQPIIPYRLDEIVREPQSIIVMAEGEKCADFLANGGFLATSSRDLPASLPWFEGRTVVILPDNDDAGQGYAKAAARKIEEAGGKPFVVPLPDLEKAGDDICDWNGSPDDLVRLIERAVSGFSKADGVLPSLDLAALALTRASPVEFAIERVAPMGEVTLFTGPGGGGKSLLAHQLCTVGAAGIGNCLGLAMTAGPTIYVTCEDAAEHLHFRQERLCEALGVPMASLAGKLHIVSLRGELDNELEGSDDKGNYSPSPAYHRLAATIRATGAKLVALDNVAHLFSGNENDRHDVTRFVNLLNRLARDTGAAILLVGHPNKSGDTYSGSTAWLNAVRSQVWIDRQRDADGSVIDPDARVLRIGKANYTALGDAVSFRWHNWAFVRDQDLPPSQAAEYRELSRAHHVDKKFLECLAKASTEKRATSPSRSASNYAPRMFAAMTVGKGVTAREYEGAMERMLHLGTIANDQRIYQRDNRTWATGLGLLESAQTLAQTMHKPVHTGAQSFEREPQETAHTGAQNCTHSAPIYKYIPGAASGASAPDIEDDLDWSSGAPSDE